MKKIRELQLKALDVLGRQAADIGAELDKLTNLTNPFDVEAKLYFIKSLGTRLATTAERIHKEMHLENSEVPHLDCNHVPNAEVWDFIFGKGLL